MNKRTGWLVAAMGLTAALTGCATTDDSARIDDTDWQKVAMIEHYHRSRGSTVVWFNYPQKRSTVADAPATPN